MPLRPALVVAFCAFAASGGASALTCYTVLDRNDNVVYRDTYPPVDLSDQGQQERDRLRARGEHLIAMESDRCPSIEFFTGSAGSPSLNVDEVVAGMAVRGGSTAGATGAPAGSRAASTGTRAAPAATPARPPAKAKR